MGWIWLIVSHLAVLVVGGYLGHVNGRRVEAKAREAAKRVGFGGR